MFIKNKVVKYNLHLDTLMDRIIDASSEEHKRTEFEREMELADLTKEMATREPDEND